MSTSPKIPYSRGRFSVSRITTPTSQRDTGTEISQKEIVVQKPENGSYQVVQESEDKYPPKSVERRKTPSRRKSRSDAFEAFRSRRKSGATEANLLVAKSWADIVKLGVARTPVKNVKHGVRVQVTKKKLTKSKTPARKVKGHVSTGHADSPATIVIGRAHSRTIPLAGRTPRVVKNYSLIQRMDVNESFTGMSEMFTTPKGEHKASRSFTPAKAPAEELSVMLTPEESGEMIVSPLSTTPVTKNKQYSQDAVSRFLRGNETQSSSKPKLQRMSKGKSPKAANLESGKETNKTPQSARRRSSKVDVTESTLLNDLVGLRRIMKTPREKAKSVLDSVALKRLLRTPRPKRQSVVDELAAAAKSRSEKSDFALVGIKRLMKTPKEKRQEVLDMVGVSRIVKTPKQKGKLIESNLGIRRLMRTPKEYSIHAKKRLGQKVQPVEDMIGISRIMKTPKNKMQPIEDLMGIKRLMASPKQKSSPLEDLRGISRLLRTPKERVVPLVRASTRIKPTLSDSELNYSGIKELFDTPKEIKMKSTKDFTGSSTVQETTEENELLPLPQSKMLSTRKNPEKELQQTLKVEDKNDKTPGRLRRKLETSHTHNKSLSVETEDVGTSLTESKSILLDKMDSPLKRRVRPPRGSVEPVSSTDKDSSVSKNEELAAELQKAFGKATTSVARRLKKPAVKETAKAPVRLGRSLRNTDIHIVSELVKIITPSKLQQRQPAQNQKGKVMESLPTEKAPTLLEMPVSLLNKVTKKAVLKRGKGRLRGALKGLSGQDTSDEDPSLKNVEASNLLENVTVVDQVVADLAPMKLGKGKRDTNTDVKNLPAAPRTHGKKGESPVEVKDAKRPTRGRNKALLVENTEPIDMLPLTRRRRTQTASAGIGLKSLEKSIPNNSEQQTNRLEKPSIHAKVKKSVKWHPLVTDVTPSEPESAKETQTKLPKVVMVSSEKPAVEVEDPLIPARKSRGRVASTNPPASVQELEAEKRTRIAKSVLIEIATNASTKEVAVEVSELITSPRRGRKNKLETLHRLVSDSTAAEVLAVGSQPAGTRAEQTVGENSSRRRTTREKQATKTTPSKESTLSTNELLVEKDAAAKQKGLKMQKTVSASPRGRRKNEMKSAVSDFEKSIQEQEEHLTADVAIESTNVEKQNAEDKQVVGEKYQSRSKTAKSRRTAKGVLAEEKPDRVSNGIAVKDKVLEVPQSVILNPRRGRSKLEHLPSSVSLSDYVSNSIGSDSSEVSCVADDLVAETLTEETVAEKFSSKRKTARGKRPKLVIQVSPPKASVSNIKTSSLDIKYSVEKQSVKDDEIAALEKSKGPEFMPTAATPRRGKSKQSTVNESFTILSKLNEANTVNGQIAESNIETKKRRVGRKQATDTSSQSLASAIANTSTLSDLGSTMLLHKTSMTNEKSSRRIGRGRATNQSNPIPGDGENLPEDQLIISKKSFRRTETTTVVVPARAGRRGQAGVLPETDEAPSDNQRRGVKRKLTGKEVATLLVSETEKQPESSPTKIFLRVSSHSKALGTAVDSRDCDQKKDVDPDGLVKNRSETAIQEQNVLSTKTRGKARKVEPKSPEVPSPVKQIAKKRGKPKVGFEPQPTLTLTESKTSPKKAKMEVSDTLLKARGLRKEKRRPPNENKVTPDVEMKRTRARTRK